MTEMSYDLTYIWMVIWLIWMNTSPFLIFEMPYELIYFNDCKYLQGITAEHIYE